MIYGRDNMEHDRIKQWLEDVHIHDFIEERLEKELEQTLQMELNEFYVTYYLFHEGRELRLNELKELFILSHSALSRLIQKMSTSPKPLITREKCNDDRRGIKIGLTEFGMEQIKKAEPIVANFLADYDYLSE